MYLTKSGGAQKHGEPWTLKSGGAQAWEPYISLRRPAVLEDKALVEATLSSALHRVSFVTAFRQHSGNWLFVLPIASCGLKLDDEAVRVAVA